MKMLQATRGRTLPQTGSSAFPSPQSGIPTLLIRTVGSEKWFKLAHIATIAPLSHGAWAPLSPQQPFLPANACLCQVQTLPGSHWLFPDSFSVTDTVTLRLQRGQDLSRWIKGMPLRTWIWRYVIAPTSSKLPHAVVHTPVILAVGETETRQGEFQGHIQTTL